MRRLAVSFVSDKQVHVLRSRSYDSVICDHGSGTYEGFDSTPPQPTHAVLPPFVHSKTVEIRSFPQNDSNQGSSFQRLVC